MTVEQSINAHLFYDYNFSSAKSFLNESGGFYDPLLRISEDVYRSYLFTIKDSVLKNGFFNGSFSIDGKMIKDAFFDRMVVYTMFNQEHVPIADISGSYIFNKSGQIDGEYVVTISIISHAQDDEFRNKFVCFMCHELTHAYEDYQEYKSTGKSYVRDIEPAVVNRFHLANLLASNDKDLEDLYSIIQYTLSSEKSSEPATFAAEIMMRRRGGIVANYSNMSDFFKDTNAYRTLVEREGILKNMKSISDEERRRKIELAFNSVYMGSDRQFDDIMNFLTKLFNDKKKRMITVGSKAMVKTVECFVSDALHFHFV